MATQALTISRRAALAAFAVLPVLPLVAPVSSLAGEIEHINALLLSDDDQRIDGHYRHYMDVLHKIEDLPADSLDNLRTKARALKTIYTDGKILDDAGESADVRLARQIINGLLTLPVAA